MTRKIIGLVAMLAVILFILIGCATGPADKTVKEAAEEYCWTDEEIEDYVCRNKEPFEMWDLCTTYVHRIDMLDVIAEEYEPDELLKYAPYTDRVMADIVLSLYRDEIISLVVNEYSIDELMAYKD